MFINTFLYHTILKVNQGTVVEHLFMNKVYILYLHTHTLLYQTVLTTEQLLMDKVYVLYVYIYLLTSNIVDTYKGNVVEQGLCFMCLLQYLSFKHFDNWRTVDEQGLYFMFLYTFLLISYNIDSKPRYCCWTSIHEQGLNFISSYTHLFGQDYINNWATID